MSSQTKPRTPQPPENLIDFAQNHEREWGNENYLNRPTLAEILNAPVVVFWKPLVVSEANPRQKSETRETITLHSSLEEIEQYLNKAFFRVNFSLPDKQPVRIFHKGRKVKIKGVKVIFEQDAPHDNDF